MSLKRKLTTTNQDVFIGCQVYILPAALGPKRRLLLETQMTKTGANVITKLSDVTSRCVTHVIVEETILHNPVNCIALLRSAGLDLESRKDVKVVGTQWVTKCLKDKVAVDTKQYELQRLEAEASRPEYGVKNEVVVRNTTEEDTTLKKNETQVENNVWQPSQPKQLKTETVDNFACSRASSSSGGQSTNLLITTELQKLADAFRSSGDYWRSYGYDKAISSIKAYNKEITSYEEAAALPGVGKKMAAKVAEIVDSGRLRKVDEICGEERMKVVELFTKIWGVGPATADAWYQKGYRTLEDLKRASLTKQQTIGLKHFDDIQTRIPREEVKQIADLVSAAANEVDPSVTCVVAGSYRRGKTTCGDIDILIAKDTDKSSFLTRLIELLKATGLITDDLVSMESSGEHKKYMGLCRLPGDAQRPRRLDVFVVPKAEFASALMHYTGSALFNRSIRLLALKKGMSLSEHSLQAGIVRNCKETLNSGYVILTPTEESIFSALGLDYRPPEERDH